MKSERAKKYLDKYCGYTACIAKSAVELAEQETEERMQTKAHKIILDMMTGIFHGDMPQKIADEFIQKLTE